MHQKAFSFFFPPSHSYERIKIKQESRPVFEIFKLFNVCNQFKIFMTYGGPTTSVVFSACNLCARSLMCVLKRQQEELYCRFASTSIHTLDRCLPQSTNYAILCIYLHWVHILSLTLQYLCFIPSELIKCFTNAQYRAPNYHNMYQEDKSH